MSTPQSGLLDGQGDRVIIPTKDDAAGQEGRSARPEAASLSDRHPGAGTSKSILEPADASETLKAVEETLSVSKRQVVTDRVRVSTRTEVHEEIVDTALDHVSVDVTRVPIDRVVDQVPQVRSEGETTIVPVFEERIVLVKQLVLVEELHITRRVEHENKRTPVSLRRQHVDIEHLDSDGVQTPPENPRSK